MEAKESGIQKCEFRLGGNTEKRVVMAVTVVVSKLGNHCWKERPAWP